MASGFEQDPLQFINLIADNLRDRYQSGFPILKELIQNTDDSEASELHFGRSPGLPTADHSLLQGPGLFFINNGSFTSADARGIRSFGQNSKAADTTSIGKFGLGMKSVFHFCEAFFFLAHDGARPYEEVLNPWSGHASEQSLHSDWDELSEGDAQAIRRHLALVTNQTGKNPTQSFILWLPLRRRAHLILQGGEQTGAIVSEYPGDDPALLAFLEEEDLPVRLAALMPMMRHLKDVAYWDLQGEDGTAKPRFEVRLGEGAKRLSLLPVDSQADGPARNKPSSGQIAGKIYGDTGLSRLSLGFSGREGYDWNQELKAMHCHELWPSSYVRDKMGHSKEAKDKARPHGAVFFSRSPGRGRLITNWSVFLPLDEAKALETIRCDGENEFRLTLHGYFFVDAGRQKVHGLEGYDDQAPNSFDSEESLRRAWNYELLHSTVLPLLLPALDAFCADERLGDKAKTALSEALKGTSLVSDFLGPITAHHSWLREITSKGIAWMLHGAERPVLMLPDPPDRDTSRPWRLFPTLTVIAKEHCLAVADAPNILNPSVDAQWQEDQLLVLLESVDARTLFADSKLLDYLESFLADAAGPYRTTLSVKRALSNLMKQGLVINGEEVLRQNEARVQRIVTHLEPSSCFRIDNDLPRPLLQGLLSANTEALPLPARFFPQEFPADAALTVEDAQRLLTELEHRLDEAGNSNTGFQRAALNLAAQLIRGVPKHHRSLLMQSCNTLRILGGFDCVQGRRALLSVQEIRSAQETETLFGSAEGTTEQARLGLAAELQRVLPRERVLVINRETASLALGTEGALPSCDQHAVLRCLGLKPRILGGLQERAELAKQANNPSGEQEIRGLRFLLHANPNHFEDDDTLWVLGRRQASVWQKLWTQLMGGTDHPWNLLDSSAVDALSRREWDVIDIHEINAQAVLDEIRRKGTATLTPSLFDQDECEQILKEVRNSDDELWRSLPFHWTQREAPVAGDADNAYLDFDKVSLPGDMLRGVQLIQLSTDAALAQRQRRLLKARNEQAVIRITLDQDGNPRRWRAILDTLFTIEQQGTEPDPELKTHIRTSKWLPLADGGVTKPEDVIDLDTAEEEIDRVLAHEPGAFVTSKTLSPAIFEHPYFPNLRKHYFARGKQGLEQLGAALEALDDYQIGAVRFNSAEALADAGRVFGEHPSRGWQLLSALTGKMGAEDCFDTLLPGMTGATNTDSLVEMLNWISLRGGDASRMNRAFNSYLDVFAQNGEASSSLNRLKLLNQESRWASSAQLVSGVPGVAPHCKLDADQARILAGLIFQEHPGSGSDAQAASVAHASETSATGSILRDYFDPWEGRVASPLIGLFVLLFGGDQPVRGLCRDILGQHSLEWLLGQIPWNPPRSQENATKKTWLEGFDLEQALDYFRMAVRVHKGETLNIHSILGTPITVDLDQEFTNLFVGRPSYYLVNKGDGYRVELALRPINPADHSDAQLSGLLKSSADYFLGEVYNQHRPDLDSLWNDLDQSDQVDIELARALMLDNMPFYLKQLGTHQHPKLSEKLAQFRHHERREKEFGQQPRAAEFRRNKEEALAELQQLIERDEEVQQAILHSVQRKIQDYQYQAESIPFELFQNADDALRNLELIDAYPAIPGDFGVEELPPSIRRFVIEADTGQIHFMHWGRAVNQVGGNGFPGRERGFDRDLENMLILSASDKGEDATGKFGLGFKSVWLASNRPTIVSGRLRAVIVGGILPVPSHGEITQRLTARLTYWQQDRQWPGTAIHLPLLENISEETVLDRFCSVAGTMAAFSRSLRTVEIHRANGQSFSAGWEPSALNGVDAIEIGRIRQTDDAPLLAMKISLGTGALLLAVGPSGFAELPEVIPSLWVTAPIREQERLGFTINAMFEVDAGRSRLSAEVKQNEVLARKLGSQLAAVLEQLRTTVTEHWADVASSLELAGDTTPYDFWHSLWRTLMVRLPQMKKDSGTRILATALLSEGLRDLARAHEIIPNGLPSGLQRLIRATDAKTVLKDALSDASILQVVSKANCFRSSLPIDSAVTPEMATCLRLLIPSIAQQTNLLHSITLTHLILRLDRHRPISPSDANLLGQAIHAKRLEEWEKAGNEHNQEAIRDFKMAAEKAGELRFLSANGTAKRCKQLLSDQGSEDEKRRRAFAPDDARLANGYSERGTAFFLWCREKLEAPTEQLKEWLIHANEPEQRKAGLEYLLDGELAPHLVKALHERGLAGTWLASIDEQSELLSEWQPDRRLQLVYQILKTPEESRIAFQSIFIPLQQPIPIDADAALERIYQWWDEERIDRLEQYRLNTYPEGRLPELRDDDAGNFDRPSWLLLLLLGGFHTMGRVQPEQHRTFIEDCQRRGWWTVFTDPNPVERFEDWMGVLDQYIDQQDDQQDYEQWMMRFPIIYKLSRHLDDYAELLLQLDRHHRQFDLANALQSAADPDQQGGGVRAPALPKTLGIGANFVIRELIRLQVMDSPDLREHAFVPYRRVRQLIAEMGGPEPDLTEPRLSISPILWEFLNEHMNSDHVTFQRDFDIPLRIVAGDGFLQEELLGRTLRFDDRE